MVVMESTPLLTARQSLQALCFTRISSRTKIDVVGPKFCFADISVTPIGTTEKKAGQALARAATLPTPKRPRRTPSDRRTNEMAHRAIKLPTITSNK